MAVNTSNVKGGLGQRVELHTVVATVISSLPKYRLRPPFQALLGKTEFPHRSQTCEGSLEVERVASFGVRGWACPRTRCTVAARCTAANASRGKSADGPPTIIQLTRVECDTDWHLRTPNDVADVPVPAR
jgi:hypothetical protein